MKKKLFVVMMAIVAMFTTSCQKEMESDANVGETSIVSFNLSTPEISTRAYGDGTTATKLQYAVYDAAGNELTELTETKGTIDKSTTVTLQLTNGNDYSIVFWAAAPNAPYNVDFANKTMTVDYDKVVSNSDDLDAFYAYHTFKVSGVQTETVTLKRPFAQLNIGTSDYAISQKAGYVPTKSSVTVKQVYNTLNFVDGTVSGETDAVFAMTAIDRNEVFPVAGNEYLAMNYLLVPAYNNIVDVDFTYADDSDNAKTRTVTAVPVQRNYRTNIFGEILTSNVSINVNIEPQFVGNVVKVSTWDEFTAAASVDGNYIVLANDISNNNSYTILGNVTVDLNGKTLEITDPTKRINIGNKNNKNAPKPNVTIKNGNLHSKVYAQTGNVVLSDIKFGGTIAYAGDAQGVITVGSANLLAERCDMSKVEANAAASRPRALSTEGLSNGYLKLIDCNFPAASDGTGTFVAKKLLRTYINPLSGNAKLELTNCKFGVACNIDFAASYVWSNMKLTGCSGGFTFTIPRDKDSLTEEETAIMTAVKQNNSGTIKAYYNGTLVTY